MHPEEENKAGEGLEGMSTGGAAKDFGACLAWRKGG